MPEFTSDQKVLRKRKKPGIGTLGVTNSIAGTLEGAVFATLGRAGKSVPAGKGRRAARMVEVETMRLRSRSTGIDRRFVVESSLDPLDPNTVLLRVKAVSNTAVPAIEAPSMLTTQQAAAVLNVSRPYVLQLADNGEFDGVEFTKGHHRRIPAAEVERVRRTMQSGMRKAIVDIARTTEDASVRERDDAKQHATRRWVAKG